jgi:hypothetical protein
MKAHQGIIILIIVTLISIIFIKREAFANYANSNESDMNIKFCPFSSSPYLFKGDTICCKKGFNQYTGCLDGKPLCSLSSIGNDSCGKVYRKYLNETAIKFCPKEMPSYYEEKTGEMRCYGGVSTADGIAPLAPGQPQCKVYKNEKDFSDPKSCYNLKQLDSLPCLTKELCEKDIIPIGNGIPSIISQTFMASNKMPGGKMMKMPRTCYYDDTIRKYWNVVWPHWEKEIKFEDLGFICSTADNVFVKMSKPTSSLKYF